MQASQTPIDPDVSFPKCLFNTTYDGYPARKVHQQANANRFMDFLALKRVPYRLKIVRKRQEPAFFLFQLVGGGPE